MPDQPWGQAGDALHRTGAAQTARRPVVQVAAQPVVGSGGSAFARVNTLAAYRCAPRSPFDARR
jgi:hypothetical protein